MKHSIIFLWLAIISFEIQAVTPENISIHGKVINVENESVAGASVTVPNSRLGVNTNANGEYFLNGLPAGKVSIRVSFIGYEAKVVNVDLQEGTNEMDFTLERGVVTLDFVTVTAQQREQQMLDIPITMSSVSAQMLENANVRNLEQLADFIPGLSIRTQTPHRPNIAIRGLTSDETSPTAQPRVSVYMDNVPTSRASMAVTELYDMERVEVMKGPQGTLFGRGSQIGAINFITKKPTADFGGYVSVETGNYGLREFEGAINMPVIENKLMARASGIYSYQDGYIKNTSGGRLNGKNTIGGRFSARYLPIHNLKIDLVVNYQKDDNPGTAFMSQRYPNVNGVSDIFQYEASLDAGKDFFNKRSVFGSMVDAKYYFNENNYLSYITSYYTNTVDHHYDGDGSIAPAIDMSEFVDANQFTQELRYNFSLNSRLNGFVGASYWREDVDYTIWFGPDEQYMSYLLLQMPQYMINGDGTLGYPMPGLPNDPQLGPLAGMPLPANHEEEMNTGAINQSTDFFIDASYLLLPRLSFTAGIRGTFESFKTTTEARMIGTTPSTLGMLLGNYPNFFFKERTLQAVKRDFWSMTYRANLKYDISPSSNVFLGYAKGRRPNVLQFNSAGEHEVMNAESVHSFDVGFKWTAKQRYWFDVGIFYQLYNDFQTSKWDNANYLVDDAGRATSYGAELTAKAALTNYLEVFGNYAYIHARFDDTDSEGSKQEYAGKTFRQTPENSFMIGLNAKAKLSRDLQVIFTPTYSWRSHIWFEDSNEMQPEDPSLARLEQDAYGLLHANLAFKFNKPNLTLSVFACNLLGEQYVIGAGNTGMMFGVPTYVPGAPRMFGAKLNWRF
ncbi:MAG: TonB-dependent receptor [Dysgonamonadaceae bacterium]|jgi:outer membrane receptor protein involved in Fe transport|nr:TonB-dependent receptor [Dysgonamonadaceae bacterium]